MNSIAWLSKDGKYRIVKCDPPIKGQTYHAEKLERESLMGDPIWTTAFQFDRFLDEVIELVRAREET